MTTLFEPQYRMPARPMPCWPNEVFNETARLRASKNERLESKDNGRAVSGAEIGYSIIGESAALREVMRQVAIVAPMDTSVLILGETGTGKELIADAIHRKSSRRNKNLVKVNCAAMPAGLLESEMFGHEQGAFTGAISRRVGRFEMAHQGTLFLDEIGDIPLELQPKLLRVLQEHAFERVGGAITTQVDTRIVAATSRDLPGMVGARQFRSDLFYRLNVFPIRIPPLRERVQDIPLLVNYFVTQLSERMSKKIKTIPVEVMKALAEYSWPGNIRELKNFIERSVILTQGHVLAPPLQDLSPVRPVATVTPQRQFTAACTLKEIEREHILLALSDADWVVGGPMGAAARLGLKRTTLAAKMQKLGICRPRRGGEHEPFHRFNDAGGVIRQSSRANGLGQAATA